MKIYFRNPISRQNFANAFAETPNLNLEVRLRKVHWEHQENSESSLGKLGKKLGRQERKGPHLILVGKLGKLSQIGKIRKITPN